MDAVLTTSEGDPVDDGTVSIQWTTDMPHDRAPWCEDRMSLTPHFATGLAVISWMSDGSPSVVAFWLCNAHRPPANRIVVH